MVTQFVQEVSADGLHLPRELTEQWGAHAGEEVIVQCDRDVIRIVRAELDAGHIAETAATYVLDHVGDAAAVEPPRRIGDRWQVPVVLSYRAKLLGTLTYSMRGELVPDASDSPESMREQSRDG